MQDRDVKKKSKRNTGKRKAALGCSSKPAPALPSTVPSQGAFFTRGDLWVYAVLIAAMVAVYAPVSRYDFVGFDDPAYVRENPILHVG